MQFQFNAAGIDPAMGLEAWTDGWHPVILKSTEPKANRDPATGGHLACVIEAVDGPMKGKQQFFTLNLWHATSAQAVEIANKTLSALTYVTLGANQGRLTFNDTNELCNIPFYILASRQADNPSRNEFRGFKDMRGNDPKSTGSNAGPAGAPGPAFGAPPVAPAAPAAPAAPPAWGAPPAAPNGSAAPGMPPAGNPSSAPAGSPAGGWGGPPATAPASPSSPPPAWGAPPPPAGAPAAPQQTFTPPAGPQAAPAAAPAWGAPPAGPGAPAAPPTPPPAWGAPQR